MMENAYSIGTGFVRILMICCVGNRVCKLAPAGAMAEAPQGPVTINLNAAREKNEITIVLPSTKAPQLVGDKP